MATPQEREKVHAFVVLLGDMVAGLAPVVEQLNQLRAGLGAIEAQLERLEAGSAHPHIIHVEGPFLKGREDGDADKGPEE
jgi:hypothetical protein